MAGTFDSFMHSFMVSTFHCLQYRRHDIAFRRQSGVALQLLTRVQELPVEL